MSLDILNRIRRDGFVHLDEHASEPAFVALARSLGTIVDDTTVKLVPGKRTYLARPDAIPMHTDHPKAALVAWRCEAQDLDDGASLLVDGRVVVDGLDGRGQEALSRVLLPAVVRAGDEPLPTPIVAAGDASRRVFYAPWLEPADKTAEAFHALGALRNAISSRRATPVRLRPGEVLVVDNRRMLHGRGPLTRNSARRLRRLWIAI